MRARGWRDRWMYIAGPPGWRPASTGLQEMPVDASAALDETYDPVVPPGLAMYGFAQFVVALAAAFALLLNVGTMPQAHVAAAAFYVAVSLAGIGGVFESARWAAPIEVARMAVLGGACVALGWTGAIPMPAAAGGVAFCGASLAWFIPRRGALTETELAPLM